MSDSFLDADLSELLRKGYAELEQALHFEEQAQKQLDFQQKKVAQITAKIIQLSIASDDEKLMAAIKETGLTGAIRTILKGANHHLTAPEIRDRLEQIGYEVSEYQNFLATLYLTLQRLEKQGEVHRATFEGKKVYGWQFARDKDPLTTTLAKNGRLTRRQQRKLREAREAENLAKSQRLTVQKLAEGLKLPPPRRLPAKPAWWKYITANGTEPLNYSRLTPTQRREARALGLVDESKEKDYEIERPKKG